ncbi:MAG TPA: ATP-binding protein [Anaerolineales bacterium]|jgi:signal transduction histidine kinase
MTSNRAPSKIIPRAFPGIKPEEVQELIESSRVRTVPAGTVLCHEDAVEHTFYMLLDGDVEVTKDINSTEARLLKILTAGDFFGEMALIHNAPRAATVTTTTTAVLLELDKDAFDRILQHSPSVAIAMVREISSRLRQNDQMAIEDLRMRAEELAAAYQKLAEQELTRREFLTSVAHELRSPLMAASGYLQILQKGLLSGNQLQAAIDTTARNIARIVSLVNDILFLQEIELVLPEFQPVNMTAIAENVVRAYGSRAVAAKVKLGLATGAGNLPLVTGDSKSLERALTALVDNAIKFSPEGGEVDVSLKGDQHRLTITVQDHGIGIDPEILPRIFDRFYHVEKSDEHLFGGLGLGLAITRQVIQQHSGSLEVESTPGKGSTFTIFLEAADAKK